MTFRHHIDRKAGIWGIRIGKRYWMIKAPWNSALYSERYQYGVTTLASARGWRLLYRRNR